MTKEEKELLLQDLCLRLPYKVRVYSPMEEESVLQGIDLQNPEEPELLIDGYGLLIENCKPYLRPMTSMTKEEKKYIFDRWGVNSDGDIEPMFLVELSDIVGYIGWLNSRHFDYRGLIEKGLAIEAPDGMYNN